MNFDYTDFVPNVSNCPLYDNGHRFVYSEAKSLKEETIFDCLCGAILGEFEDSGTGC